MATGISFEADVDMVTRPGQTDAAQIDQNEWFVSPCPVEPFELALTVKQFDLFPYVYTVSLS